MKKPKITAIEVFNRQCLFCGDNLPAHCHKLRKFCPSKFGVNNYCKYHHRDLVQQAEQSGEHVVKTLRDDPGETDVSGLSEDLEQLEIDLSSLQESKTDKTSGKRKESPTTEDRDTNLKLIDSVMVGKIECEIEIDQMLKQGYKIPVFDKKVIIPNTNKYYVELGDYGLFWYKKNIISIINLNEILWLH